MNEAEWPSIKYLRKKEYTLTSERDEEETD